MSNRIVYGYFAGASWTKPALAYTQYVQLLGGISFDLWLLAVKKEPTAGNVVATVLLTSYLFLHRRDVRMSTESN
jgi:hypothetical protein